jgi:MFS family permease
MAGRWTSLLGIRRDALKPFGAVWLSHLLVEVFLLMHPALVPIFREEFGLSILQAGLLISIPSICRLIIVIPTGILADKYGSFRFVVVSLLLGGLSAILLSQTASVFILILSITLIMISVTLYHPPGMSVVSSLFPNQSERSRAMGWHGASGCIGQAVGTISLGLLLAQYGWRFSYLLFSFPVLFWGVALAKIGIPRSSRKDRSLNPADPVVPETAKAHERSPVKKRGFLMFLSVMGLSALANGGIMAFMTTYLTSAQNLSLEMASIIFGLGPIIGIFGSVAAGYVSAKFGDKNSLVLIFLGQAIFLLGLIAIPFLALALFSFLMYQLFNHAVWTPSTSMVASFMGETGGGTAYSLFYFSHDLLGSASPLLAAVLIENLRFGLIAPFVFALGLLIMCTLMVRFIKSE